MRFVTRGESDGYKGRGIEEVHWGNIALAVIASFVVLTIIIVGVGSGCRAYNRYQKRADANNNVKVTHINIRNAQQQAQVKNAQIAQTKAAAEIRFQESVGIKRSQDEINKTLTPAYLQWEAIQSQMKMAQSPNNTMVYIPSGPQGIPLVKTTP